MKNASFVKNPLTVISIFASLTEVVCGTVTPFINDINNQKLFLIFVIGFPILLVLFFFLTLNLNHKVLYSPSDFNESDRNIANLFYGKEYIFQSSEQVNKQTHKSNFLYNLSIEQEDEKLQPYLRFSKVFYDYIEKLIPSEKILEMNFDMINTNFYNLEIRIKPEFVKDNISNRASFILNINHEAEYDETKYEYSKEKFTTGLIVGSGYKSHKESAESLGTYVIQTITEILK